MEVTLQDIAKELDLSAATISRSLRHDKAIRPETRARVNEVARQMGYKGRVGRPRRPVDQTAKSNTLGLLVAHHSFDSLQHDTNLQRMMAGIMSVTDKQGMHFKMHIPEPSEAGLMEADPSFIPSLIRKGECQALIAHGLQDEQKMAFLAHRLPVVSMGRIYRRLPIDAAVGDNLEGVHELVTHLVELGHRRLAWVGAYYHATFMEEREAGFFQGCRKHGLEIDPRSFFGPEIYKKDQIDNKEVLLSAVNAGVTAFVCGNDAVADAVIQVLEEAGLSVPDNVSVTGFDASYPTRPGVVRRLPTSIDPNFFEIGKVAARLALQRVAHPMDQPCIVNVRGKLVLGDSAAPPPGISPS